MAGRGFENFDFSRSADWQSYYQNIFPPPPYTKLEAIKEKWYKAHIDPSYVPKGSVPPPSSPSSVPPQPSSGQVPRNSRQAHDPPPSSMELFQVLLFSLALPGLYFGKALHLIIGGHLAGIIHSHNMPRMSIDYWRPIIMDDNMHSIAFALLFLVLPSSSIWIAPCFLGILVYIPGILLRMNRVPEKIKEISRRVAGKQLAILQARADCEVWVGFGLIALWIMGYAHWISPIIFWQYMRMRYLINHFSKVTFSNLRVKGDSMFYGKPVVGNLWEKLKALLDWMNKIEANPQNAGSSCEIF